MSIITYVGLDVHTTNYTICAYTIENDKTFAEITINPDINELEKYLKQLQKIQGKNRKIICGYEAGCLGYSLYHQLVKRGYECVILAPTTMPSTVKEIKTNKREARKIAKCLAYGTYSKVFVPSDEDDAVKKFDNDMLSETLTEYLITLDQLLSKIERFDERIAELAKQDKYAEKAAKLGCFREIKEHTALSFLVEIGDFKRFPTANQFAAFLGLVPGEPFERRQSTHGE